MGILLTFMFLWNMLGALILIPALSYFLLREKTLETRPVEDAPLAPAEEAGTSHTSPVPHALSTPE
jgi:hypothetical protein